MNTENSYPDTDMEVSSDVEKCGICLEALRYQEKVAHPRDCKHMFCFDCLKNWAKRSTTCPLDRKPFRYVCVGNQADGWEHEVTFLEPVNFWTHFERFGNAASLTGNRELLYYYDSFLLHVTMCQLTLESKDDSVILSFLDNDGNPMENERALEYLSELSSTATVFRRNHMQKMEEEECTCGLC